MEAISFDSEALYQKPHNYAVTMQVPGVKGAGE